VLFLQVGHPLGEVGDPKLGFTKMSEEPLRFQMKGSFGEEFRVGEVGDGPCINRELGEVRRAP